MCIPKPYHFGYKPHALCGTPGVILPYDLSKASMHDINYMKDIKFEYHHCSIYGDKGYIGEISAMTILRYINYMNGKPLSFMYSFQYD